jgi:hypothetical protein
MHIEKLKANGLEEGGLEPHPEDLERLSVVNACDPAHRTREVASTFYIDFRQL